MDKVKGWGEKHDIYKMEFIIQLQFLVFNYSGTHKCPRTPGQDTVDWEKIVENANTVVPDFPDLGNKQQ